MAGFGVQVTESDDIGRAPGTSAGAGRSIAVMVGTLLVV
jgi:hypothetical protein